MDFIKKRTLQSCIVILLIVTQSCNKLPEFEPLNFVRTNYEVDKRFDDSQTLNDQSPLPDIQVMSETYRVVGASDLHITGNSEQVERFFSYTEEEDPSLVLIVGDISNGLSHQMTSANNQFKAWNQLPSYFVAGNHDLFFSWSQYVQLFGSSTYTFTVHTPTATDLYIGLESGSGTLGKKQTAWLVEQLQKRYEYRHCIVFTHTNFFARQFDTNGIYTKEERMALLSLFAQYEVSMVISGHSHKENRTTFGNVRYITMPPLVDGGYMVFEVEESITTRTMQL